MSFKDEGYEVVRNALTEQLVEYTAIQFELLRKNSYIAHNVPDNEDTKFRFSDVQIPKSYSHYSPFFSESLLIMLQKQIEEIVGIPLHPCYSYARIYYKDADMKIHKDRPSCQYSSTICLTEDVNNPWPIYFKNRKSEDVPLFLKPGDMVVYNGTELEHWRLPFQGDQQMQCFIHYVDAKGPYAEWKHDKRKWLGRAPVNQGG